MQLTDPAIDSQRNPSSYLPTSVARLHCLFGNSSLGFVKRLWKQLEENRIVLLDRSYYDIFIDFLWCRYSGPHWLARCLVFVTPQPDLWVLLDAPHEVTCTREEQIQENETVRRLEASRSFVSLTKHHAIIDAAQSTNRVVADVHTAIIDTLAQRTNSRFKNRL
jgi:thymidylate kinase